MTSACVNAPRSQTDRAPEDCLADLSGFHFAGEKILDPFAKQRFATVRVGIERAPG
jgi:hypothetical protein